MWFTQQGLWRIFQKNSSKLVLICIYSFNLYRYLCCKHFFMEYGVNAASDKIRQNVTGGRKFASVVLVTAGKTQSHSKTGKNLTAKDPGRYIFLLVLSLTRNARCSSLSNARIFLTPIAKRECLRMCSMISRWRQNLPRTPPSTDFPLLEFDNSFYLFIYLFLIPSLFRPVDGLVIEAFGQIFYRNGFRW